MRTLAEPSPSPSHPSITTYHRIIASANSDASLFHAANSGQIQQCSSIGERPHPSPFEKPLVHSALWPRFQPFMLDLSERLRCFHWSSAITASLDSSKIHRLSLCLTTMTGAPLSGGGHHGHHARELISLGPRPTPSRLIFSFS